MQLATEIVHSGIVNECWLCPCGPRPDKPSMRETPEQRYAMAELAINQAVSPTFPIRVTDHEVKETMATYDSLCFLRERHPECEFVFVIGSDWLQPGTDIRQWTSKEGRTGERLLNEFEFLVMPRPGYEVAELSAFGPRMRWLKLPDGFQMVESNASSTEVRKRAKTSYIAGMGTAEPAALLMEMDGLVPPAVLAYIRRHRLYKDLAYLPLLQRSVRSVLRLALRESREPSEESELPTAAGGWT